MFGRGRGKGKGDKGKGKGDKGGGKGKGDKGKGKTKGDKGKSKGKGKGITCHNCGERGHIARNCPRSQRSVSAVDFEDGTRLPTSSASSSSSFQALTTATPGPGRSPVSVAGVRAPQSVDERTTHDTWPGDDDVDAQWIFKIVAVGGCYLSQSTVAPISRQRRADGAGDAGHVTTRALIDSGAMVHCCPLELAKHQPRRRRSGDGAVTLHDVQGERIATEGMIDLKVYVTSCDGKYTPVVLECYVTQVPTLIISVGKLMKGGAEVIFGRQAGMRLGNDTVKFVHDKGVFYLGLAVPTTCGTLVAPVLQDPEGHAFDFRPFDIDDEDLAAMPQPVPRRPRRNVDRRYDADDEQEPDGADAVLDY